MYNEDFDHNLEPSVIDLVSQFHQQLLKKIDNLEKENEQLKQYKIMAPKFFYDPNEDCYAFVDRQTNDTTNMSLRRIDENGEITGYASEGYTGFHSAIDEYMINNGYNIKELEPLKEMSFTEFYHKFFKPILKQNDEYNEEKGRLEARIRKLEKKLEDDELEE
jgi:hypothetical protein